MSSSGLDSPLSATSRRSKIRASGSLERRAPAAPMSEKESELLGAIGIKPCRVLSRRLVTIACERHAYLPGLIGGLITFGVVRHNSLPVALATSALAAAALALSLVAHEAGHLLVARRVRGVKPGLLLMRSTGCLSIVEGRYADARGAALFAAGGPLATLAIVVVYLGTWVLLPHGALGTALLVPGFLNLMLLAVNLLPVAPMDGYMLFRSALWASVGNRAEAETRAIRGSVLVLLSAFAVSLVVLCGDGGKGIVALFLVATLAVQHHAASRKLALSRPAS